jgi:hypothetical protein
MLAEAPAVVEAGKVKGTSDFLLAIDELYP